MSQAINGVLLSAIVSEHDYVRLDDDKFTKLLFAFSPIISKVIKLTNTNYYTFLGRYTYNGERFVYEPYVDLMKTITISITRKNVRIVYGENKVRLKRTRKGYTPSSMLETLGYIVRRLHGGNA
ncbi:hypothetical protein [Vulcanisaeta sp. JCM 16159]|uniref:hypothetical protein n=1 Tax=Vulcanisaeta sp. JCM 16159 TaxID=1295371 RepID=UPI000AF06778|nr:hypothetical protein [Vulcanisaeta sp. JCM 16159]